MLKCASVYTFEIDDPDIALEEIQTQLEEKITLLEHSVGIVMCHVEYIASGVIKRLSEDLPFDIAGVTTSSQAVNLEAGELMLSIFVMTSDDVRFKSGVTENLSGDIHEPIGAAFRKASAGEPEMPGLALVFPPLILEYAGDAYISAWEKIAPGTPLFGTLAVDDTITFGDSETIYGGASYKTEMSFILCYGNIQPRFLIATLSGDNEIPHKGEITKSDGCFVSEINNINAYKYFENIGFASNGVLNQGFGLALYVIDQKKRKDYDGVPVVRGLVDFTEDGTAIFRGDVDEGSSFVMLTSNKEDVLSSTRQKIEELNKLSGANGILLFSCIVRRMVIMPSGPLTELQAVMDTIDPDIPFMIGYAGGEICPTSVRNRTPTNRFHNYSLVILVV
ncbi:MAG: FIST C-terminal domain-containing protein [Oscillospiraceae bacterium]|nr:FIST C-terminal domain-containing protein [Oscillospiraceae bacterium]